MNPLLSGPSFTGDVSTGVQSGRLDSMPGPEAHEGTAFKDTLAQIPEKPLAQTPGSSEMADLIREPLLDEGVAIGGELGLSDEPSPDGVAALMPINVGTDVRISPTGESTLLSAKSFGVQVTAIDGDLPDMPHLSAVMQGSSVAKQPIMTSGVPSSVVISAWPSAVAPSQSGISDKYGVLLSRPPAGPLTAEGLSSVRAEGAPVTTIENGSGQPFNLSSLPSQLRVSMGEQLDSFSIETGFRDSLTSHGDPSRGEPQSRGTAFAESITRLTLTEMTPASSRAMLPVNITFGHEGWSNMVAERSALVAAQNLKFAELQLDPPELGPLQVKVTLNQDQASVTFVSASALVRDALDNSAHRLRELLGEQGIDLVDVNVSDQSADEQQQRDRNESGSTTPAEELMTAESSERSQSVLISQGIDHYI